VVVEQVIMQTLLHLVVIFLEHLEDQVVVVQVDLYHPIKVIVMALLIVAVVVVAVDIIVMVEMFHGVVMADQVLLSFDIHSQHK
jgi:hypothetical protein